MSSTPTQSKANAKDGTDSSTEWKLDFIAALKNQPSDPSSDFTIISDELTFKVHHLVASMHSNYFKRLCDPGSERKVELEDDSPLVVKLMVDYLDTFDYPEPVSIVTPQGDDHPRNSLEAHSHMFTLAAKYGIPGLRELAYSKFEAALEPASTGTDEFYQKLAADLLVAIPHIYTETPPKDLRIHYAMMAAWMAKGKRLLEYVDEDDLEEIFREVPSFATDLINELAEIAIGGRSERSEGDREIASIGKSFSKKVEISGAKTRDGSRAAGSSAPSVEDAEPQG